MKKIALCLTLVMTLLLAACGGSSASDGFVLKTAGGVELAIDASDDVLDQLGQPTVPATPSPSCDLPGTDYVYTYAGFRIKTTPDENGNNVICQIELTDDSLKTPEGLYVGMKAEDAKAAMSGKGTMEDNGEGFICQKGEMKLHVNARDGVVTGIKYSRKNTKQEA